MSLQYKIREIKTKWLNVWLEILACEDNLEGLKMMYHHECSEFEEKIKKLQLEYEKNKAGVDTEIHNLKIKKRKLWDLIRERKKSGSTKEVKSD